eukprot:COSAG02_NODE_433_length_22435_cov_151.224078_11_plen_277_part_00
MMPSAASAPTFTASAPPSLLLSELPEDALCHVLAVLQSPRDLCRAGACCRALLTTTRSDTLWESVCCREFPLDDLRRIYSQCFRGRNVVHPLSLDPPQHLRATLHCWRADAPVRTEDGAIADWCHIFQALAYWPFPAKAVRFGADTTSLLYIFECPAETTPDSDQAHPGGVYNLFARTSGQTNHVHRGHWRWVPRAEPRTWRLSPAGSTGGKDKLAAFSDDYTNLTICSRVAGAHSDDGRQRASGGVPFHSNIPPLWRKIVDNDSLVLKLGHSKRL